MSTVIDMISTLQYSLYLYSYGNEGEESFASSVSGTDSDVSADEMPDVVNEMLDAINEMLDAVNEMLDAVNEMLHSAQCYTVYSTSSTSTYLLLLMVICCSLVRLKSPFLYAP